MASVRRTLLRLIAVLASVPALFVLAVTVLEPRLDSRPSSPAEHELVGVLHVHTSASDGAGTVDQIFKAARDAGVDFVLLTDHNVRGAPAWTWRESVLLIVGEEVNTPWGHLVVAGESPVGDRRGSGTEPAGSPTPPETSGPVDPPPAVAPEEGLRIAAHPTGRPRWSGWSGDQFDGIEIWNADTERRNDPFSEWIRALALVPLRPMAGLYRLLDYPEEGLRLWDRLLEKRPVFGVCAADAHNTLPLNRSRSLDLHFPAYRHSFRLARQHVLVAEAPTGDPVRDGRSVLEALRRGRSYCSFDGLADGRGASFTVTAGERSAGPGDSLPWLPGSRLQARLPGRAGAAALVRVVRDGRVEEEVRGPDASVELPGPGVVRVEVLLDRHGLVPWILTNPVWLTETAPPPRAP